jgi:hypothetical protein
MSLYDQGMERKEIIALHGVSYAKLDQWIKAHVRGTESFSPVVTKRRPGRGITRCYVSAIRRSLAILDIGGSVSYAAWELGVPRTTIRRWRDDPAYREATFEHNPDFNYNPDDLTDRSIVAHALCRVEPNPDERLDMVLAIVGLHRVDDPKESYRQSKQMKGAE